MSTTTERTSMTTTKPSRARAKARPKQPDAAQRLRPGQLDGLILGYLEDHPAEPLGPTAVAKALQRSSGAVGNALARLAAAGKIRQAGEHPRRYAPINDQPEEKRA